MLADAQNNSLKYVNQYKECFMNQTLQFPVILTDSLYAEIYQRFLNVLLQKPQKNKTISNNKVIIDVIELFIYKLQYTDVENAS